MPIVRNVELSFTVEQVLRREGLGKQRKLQPHAMDILSDLLSSISNEHLLEPAIAYELYDIASIIKDAVYLSEEVVFHSHLLASVLAPAKQLAVIACTIGPKLEEKASTYFKSKEQLKGYLLDGIGSAAIDQLSAEACHIIGSEAAASGYQTGSPVSPGMPGMLPISEQKTLFELVPADDIGIHLTHLQVMFPIKSISMVIGIGPMMTMWTQAEVCARCDLTQTCTHKNYPAAQGI
jgi:cobalamin-dependent methionine synthase I